MLKDDYKIYEEKMNKSIDSAAADFASVRAGRANAAVLDRIMVDYYGTPTPIQQIAAISTPDPPDFADLSVGRFCAEIHRKGHSELRSGHQSPE